jgi:hypothetical protein
MQTVGARDRNYLMTTSESSTASVPLPARLVERALDLARAEVGLALVHTRRIAVRAVSALLGTIVACAFAQLAIVLLVAWPVISSRVAPLNLFMGVGLSVVVALAGAVSAFVAWAGVRERRAPAAAHPAAAAPDSLSPAPSAPGVVSAAAVVGSGLARNVVVSRERRFDTREEQPSAPALAERVSS